MKPITRADIRRDLNTLEHLSKAVQIIVSQHVDVLGVMVFSDPLMAVRVMNLANSPLDRRSREVGSLREAMSLLGVCAVRGVVLSTGLSRQFPDSVAVSRSLDTAVAARSLARSLKLDQDRAFIAGLLHNLGAVLLGHFAPDTWRRLGGNDLESPGSRLVREKEAFGVDHCQLGAEFAGEWGLPADVQHAIRMHVQPSDLPADALTDLLHAAWKLSANAHSGVPPAIAPKVLHRLGLNSLAGATVLTVASQAMRSVRCDREALQFSV